MPTATEATVDTGSRGPEGPSKGGRSASPEGSTVRPLALPEGGVCRAALCTEMHPLCAARLPKEPRLQAKPRCQCLTSQTAPPDRNPTPLPKLRVEPKLEDPGTEVHGA